MLLLPGVHCNLQCDTQRPDQVMSTGHVQMSAATRDISCALRSNIRNIKLKLSKLNNFWKVCMLLLLRTALVFLEQKRIARRDASLGGDCFIPAVVDAGANAQTCGIISQLRSGVGSPWCISPLYFLCRPLQRRLLCCPAAAASEDSAACTHIGGPLNGGPCYWQGMTQLP